MIERAAAPEDCPDSWRTFGDGELAEVLRELNPQVIVLEQWALASRLGDPAEGGAPDVPLVIDLHGSLLLENVYRRGTTDLTMDGKTKLEALRRADLLVTPAAAQLHHFASWATLAGFDPAELPLRLLPLATTRLAGPRSDDAPTLKMVYGGARWPWIDSLVWLQTAADVAESHQGVRLDVFTYDPPRHGLPFEEDLGTWPEVDAVLKGRARKGVKLHGRAEHASFVSFIEGDATVALDLWEPNPERMLASTTRTVEFLAAGLPVITVQGASWAEELVQSGAGWTVPPGDRAALTALLERLVAEPALIAAASSAALKLAAARADLATSGAALLSFADSPSRPPRAPRSIVEAIVHVRQSHLDETLRSLEGAHQAEVAELRVHADARIEKLTARHDEQTEALRTHHQRLLERADVQHREAAAKQEAQMEEATSAHRAEVERLTVERRAEAEETSARHQTELRSWRASAERAEAALQAKLDAALSEAAGFAELTRQRIAELTASHKSELDEATSAHRAEVERLTAERRAETEENAARHRTELRSLRASAETAEAALQAKLDAALSEAAERAEITRERTAELATSHKSELDELRLRLEALVSERQTELDGVRETLARRDQELRVMTEARDELQGRWTSDRAQDKEARTRLEVEARARLTAREAELRQETDDQLEGIRAELTAQLDAMAARKVVRLADSVQSALKGDGGLLGVGLASRIAGETGRIVPGVRLAKLWAEHAMDREHD